MWSKSSDKNELFEKFVIKKIHNKVTEHDSEKPELGDLNIEEVDLFNEIVRDRHELNRM